MRTIKLFYFNVLALLLTATPLLAQTNSPKELYRMQVTIEAPSSAPKSALLVFVKKNQCSCENGKKKMPMTSSDCEAFVRKNIKSLDSNQQPPPPVPTSTHEQTLTLNFSNINTSWSQTRSLKQPVPKDPYYDFTMNVLNFCVK